MENFDLKLAKLGYSLCTRDGRDAFIKSFNFTKTYPILAIIKVPNQIDITMAYKIDGKYDANGNDNFNDLMMK